MRGVLIQKVTKEDLAGLESSDESELSVRSPVRRNGNQRPSWKSSPTVSADSPDWQQRLTLSARKDMEIEELRRATRSASLLSIPKWVNLESEIVKSPVTLPPTPLNDADLDMIEQLVGDSDHSDIKPKSLSFDDFDPEPEPEPEPTARDSILKRRKLRHARRRSLSASMSKSSIAISDLKADLKSMSSDNRSDGDGSIGSSFLNEIKDDLEPVSSRSRDGSEHNTQPDHSVDSLIRYTRHRDRSPSEVMKKSPSEAKKPAPKQKRKPRQKPVPLRQRKETSVSESSSSSSSDSSDSSDVSSAEDVKKPKAKRKQKGKPPAKKKSKKDDETDISDEGTDPITLLRNATENLAIPELSPAPSSAPPSPEIDTERITLLAWKKQGGTGSSYKRAQNKLAKKKLEESKKGKRHQPPPKRSKKRLITTSDEDTDSDKDRPAEKPRAKRKPAAKKSKPAAKKSSPKAKKNSKKRPPAKKAAPLIRPPTKKRVLRRIPEDEGLIKDPTPLPPKTSSTPSWACQTGVEGARGHFWAEAQYDLSRTGKEKSDDPEFEFKIPEQTLHEKVAKKLIHGE